MLGYTDQALTDDAFDQDGFFRTGDLGRIEFGDFLAVSGRKKDVIVRGGENISPQEIEDALHRYPAITDVAVVAMPHERLGEGVCAYVIADAHVSVADIGSFLGEQGLARQKWPERVEMVDAFPRTASGKVQKNLLRDCLVAKGPTTEASLCKVRNFNRQKESRGGTERVGKWEIRWGRVEVTKNNT